MPSFVTAHTFCASRGIRVSFWVAYDYVEEVYLSKGYQNPNRKLKITTLFSEEIELKFKVFTKKL